MVVRTRLRAVFRQILLFLGAIGAIAYFGFHAVNGDHGMMAQRQYDDEKQRLSSELEGLKAEHASLERRVALLKSTAIDPDILAEKARAMLGMVHPDEVVVFLPKS